MQREDFYKFLEGVLEWEPSSMVGNEELNRDGNWDSLAFISVIGYIDEKYNKVISAAELGKVKTADEILMIVEKK
jgi:acyl carrier protein